MQHSQDPSCSSRKETCSLRESTRSSCWKEWARRLPGSWSPCSKALEARLCSGSSTSCSFCGTGCVGASKGVTEGWMTLGKPLTPSLFLENLRTGKGSAKPRHSFGVRALAATRGSCCTRKILTPRGHRRTSDRLTAWSGLQSPDRGTREESWGLWLGGEAGKSNLP
jgi:hypothetical protein